MNLFRNICHIKIIMLKTINFFPYTQFLRVNNKEKIDHNCGGIASIIILAIIIFLFTNKMIDALTKKTIFINSQTSVGLEPPMTSITTYQNDPQDKPFMMALMFLSDPYCPQSKISAYLAYEQIEGSAWNPNRQFVKNEIVLEACTSEHFSRVSGFSEKQSQSVFSKWLCLPINKIYEIGGSYHLSTSYKALRLFLNCSSSCDGVHCGAVEVFQLNSLLNPQNNQKPFQYYLSSSYYEISPKISHRYHSVIDQNVLYTDHSLFPNSQLTLEQGLSYHTIQSSPTVSNNSLELLIQRSSKTITYHKSYLKFADVLSYVGGFFSTLFSLFFFMHNVGNYFFEMTFAANFFRNKETKEVGILNFVSNFVYKLLTFLKVSPNWPSLKKQQQIRETLNKVLDTEFICKRINFLQKAMSVLLENHHLKGLYLTPAISIDETEQKFKRFEARNRFLQFLHLKIKKKDEESAQKGDDPIKAASNGKPVLKMMKEQFEIGSGSNIHKMELKSEIGRQDSAPQRLMTMITSEGLIEEYSDLAKKKENLERLEEELELGRIETDENENLEQLQLQICSDIIDDFNRLKQQAESVHGDYKCKRIYSMIEGWLREELKAVQNVELNQPGSIKLEILQKN